MDTRMRRIAGGAAIAGVSLLGFRRLGPGVRERCKAACARRMKEGGCGCRAA
jgi:hypothetical protein